jgi:microcystin-dependent protein
MRFFQLWLTGRSYSIHPLPFFMDPFIGEIRLMPYNFAPQGWAFCQGQLLPIRQYTALFSLLGTQYGGDGKVTFALPDLRGRAALGQGQGPGLSNYSQGEVTGVENITLQQAEMPAHVHTLTATIQVNADAGAGSSPTNTYLAADATNNQYSENPGSGASMAADLVTGMSTPTGGSQPHNNMMPYLTLNYCIAMEGVFPPRQ